MFRGFFRVAPVLLVLAYVLNGMFFLSGAARADAVGTDSTCLPVCQNFVQQYASGISPADLRAIGGSCRQQSPTSSDGTLYCLCTNVSGATLATINSGIKVLGLMPQIPAKTVCLDSNGTTNGNGMCNATCSAANTTAWNQQHNPSTTLSPAASTALSQAMQAAAGNSNPAPPALAAGASGASASGAGPARHNHKATSNAGVSPPAPPSTGTAANASSATPPLGDADLTTFNGGLTSLNQAYNDCITAGTDTATCAKTRSDGVASLVKSSASNCSGGASDTACTAQLNTLAQQAISDNDTGSSNTPATLKAGGNLMSMDQRSDALANCVSKQTAANPGVDANKAMDDCNNQLNQEQAQAAQQLAPKSARSDAAPKNSGKTQKGTGVTLSDDCNRSVMAQIVEDLAHQKSPITNDFNAVTVKEGKCDAKAPTTSCIQSYLANAPSANSYKKNFGCNSDKDAIATYTTANQILGMTQSAGASVAAGAATASVQTSAQQAMESGDPMAVQRAAMRSMGTAQLTAGSLQAGVGITQLIFGANELAIQNRQNAAAKADGVAAADTTDTGINVVEKREHRGDTASPNPVSGQYAVAGAVNYLTSGGEAENSVADAETKGKAQILASQDTHKTIANQASTQALTTMLQGTMNVANGGMQVAMGTLNLVNAPPDTPANASGLALAGPNYFGAGTGTGAPLTGENNVNSITPFGPPIQAGGPVTAGASGDAGPQVQIPPPMFGGNGSPGGLASAPPPGGGDGMIGAGTTTGNNGGGGLGGGGEGLNPSNDPKTGDAIVGAPSKFESGGAGGSTFAAGAALQKRANSDTGMDLNGLLSQLLGNKNNNDNKPTSDIVNYTPGGRTLASNGGAGSDEADGILGPISNLFKRVSSTTWSNYQHGNLK